MDEVKLICLKEIMANPNSIVFDFPSYTANTIHFHLSTINVTLPPTPLILSQVVEVAINVELTRPRRSVMKTRSQHPLFQLLEISKLISSSCSARRELSYDTKFISIQLMD